MLGIGKGYVYWRRLCRPPFSYRLKTVSLNIGLHSIHMYCMRVGLIDVCVSHINYPKVLKYWDT